MMIDNYLTIISLIMVAIGGAFAGIQWNVSNKIRRTEFVNTIIEKLRFDKDMAQTMYKIDYDESWYNDNFHNGNSDLEYEIDKLLSYLSYICYLKQTKNISKEEFKILQYEIIRVCKSFDVQSYLWNLYHFSIKQDSKCSFEHLVSYGIDNKLFDIKFLSCNSNLYKKRLNF